MVPLLLDFWDFVANQPPVKLITSIPGDVLIISGALLTRFILQPRRRLSWRKRVKLARHQRFIHSAGTAFTKLQGEGNWAGKLAYLRRLHPTTFEELLLTALDSAGCQIQRNSRYTGDGGIDGRFYLADGSLVLIQAKRYQDAISTKHVTDFGLLCQRARAKGLFVHTGKTPQSAKAQAAKAGVIVVSGQQLITFLAAPGDWISQLEGRLSRHSASGL